MLKPGDKAPDFTLLDQEGEPFTLSKSLEERKVWHFIYFYPKADTPGARSKRVVSTTCSATSVTP